MRVLDGEQPGYAVLVFDKQVDRPSLRLAIKSLQVGQGAYLGSSGAWERSPYYFVATRIATPNGGVGYRVGPEIVNHLLEDDLIEVSCEDGLVREDGYWANATPLMPGKRVQLLPEGSVEPPPTPPPAPPAAPTPPLPPSALPPSPPPVPRKLPRWLLPAAVAVVLLPVAVVGLTPSLRCSVLGFGCAPPQNPDPVDPERDQAAERAAAKLARDCAASMETGPESCSAEAACFTPYRAQYPHGASLADIEKLSARLAQSCQGESEKRLFGSSRQCASAASPCVVETCFTGYLSAYAHGAYVGEARETIARAKQACLDPKSKIEPVQGLLADGEYSTEARAVSSCGISRQRPHFFVCSGKISWVHEAPLATNLPPVPLQWEGAIGADGAVHASVRGNSSYAAIAKISETDREVQMRYPGCASPVVLTISRQLSAGCTRSR